MGQMVCFLSGVSLTPQTAWVFNHSAALHEKRRLQDRLALLDKLFKQYDKKDDTSSEDVAQALRWGRRAPKHSHRLVSEISAQAIAAEFANLQLFIPWRERLELIRNLRFRHVMADASCNQRLKKLSAQHAHAVLELAERILQRLECAAPLPLQTRKKLQTKVCVDFVEAGIARKVDAVLQALWKVCFDESERQKNEEIKYWDLDAQDWMHLADALKRLVQAGGWAKDSSRGGEV